jgi:pyridoxal phosphate enzyme (YggS family)
MDEAALEQFLRDRLAVVEDQIQAACARAGRRRDEVTLVAVTKTVSPRVAAALHDVGVADLGESRPQELWHKAGLLPRTVRWHQIGHLQSNKVEKTLPLVTLIHSVDSSRLLLALEKEAARQQRTPSVLLEVNASGEANKHGLAPAEVAGVLARLPDLRQVRVRGLMTMAAYEEKAERCRPTFALLRQLRDQFQEKVPPPHALNELSMGMSNDFPVAIEEGATLIRLGTVLLEGLPEEPA